MVFDEFSVVSFRFSVFRMRNSEGCHSVLNAENWRDFVRAHSRAARFARNLRFRAKVKATLFFYKRRDFCLYVVFNCQSLRD